MSDKNPRLSTEPLTESSDVPFTPSTLETVDFSVFDFVNEKLDIHTETNQGFKKVPVKWVAEERSSFQKKDPEERDFAGIDVAKAIIYPIIRIKRISEQKHQPAWGKYYGFVPPVPDARGGTITITRRINQDKTSNFANADSLKGVGVDGEVGVKAINFPSKKKNQKIVYKIISIPAPTYVEMMYEVTLISEYQQQMNDMEAPFIVEAGSIEAIIVTRDGHRFEAFIQGDIENNDNTNEMGEDLRRFERKVKIKVYGYIVGAGLNDTQPRIVERENAVEFKIQRERVIFGDMNEFISKGKFRR